ncbi:DUF4255 domain-containing protein [Chloroflexia bacterium SDU3-3]|nr:DUF4255 domain-containing protein [Chloroflexia bacterium SDU3-3]
MLSAFTIAIVSAVLKSQIENWLVQENIGAYLGADVVVSALPPDRITTGADERPQVNIYLYSLTPSLSLRRSVLPFDLHYLITAYGSGDLQHEMLLGCVIQSFASAVIDQQSILVALEALSARGYGFLPSTMLGEDSPVAQIKRLSITPQILSPEEASRIWSSLQARGRPSIAYRISAAASPREEYAK